jgi:hypothetical protein
LQPASQNSLPALLSVVATGQAQLRYQWLKSGKLINGAISETFTATAAGSYSVVVKNDLGSVTSDAAVVAAATMGAPQITTQPVSALLGTGQVANFTVAASGNPTLLYQWRKVGSTAVLSATNTLAASAPGTFNVLIKNNLGSLTSRAARLGVVSTIDLVKPAKLGTKAILSVSATGDGLLYQWMKNGIEITGSNAAVVTHRARQLGVHHVVLGVERSASLPTIERAFRNRAKALHPDRGGEGEEMQRLIAALEDARRARAQPAE